MTLIIQDRFDGAAGATEAWPGNVIGRTMDSGHVWHPGYNGKDLRLDGAGAVTGGWPVNSSNGDVWCSTPMPLADYWVEIDVNIPTTDGASYFTLFFKIQTPPTLLYGAENNQYGLARWFPVNSTSPEVVDMGGEGSLMPAYVSTNRGAATTGARTFRVTVEGTLASAYIDGVFIRSHTISGAIPNIGHVGFGMRSQSNDSNYIRVLEFRAGTVADYVPPASFWTSRTLTTEVFG